MISEMSEAGLGFVSGHWFAVGEELTIAWRFEPAEPPLQIASVVRYISKLGPSEATQTGVEFRNLSVDDRLRILTFIKKRALSTS